MKQKAYAAAGVDIDLGNKVKATLPQLLAATHRREVLGKVGGFGGLFALDLKKYREPVLVSSVDGVGTKLKIAFAMDRHDTIGADLVNHCVNDIAVLGAEPLFFLDYLGTGKLEPHVFTDIIKGFARACAENNCALIGGETAQMPGFYQKGEYDVSGTIVGVVEKSKMLNGQKTVRRGDAVIGIASSGLHTNGYSLARKIFFEQLKLKPTSRVPGLKGTIGEELLKEHISYGPLVQKLLKKFNIQHSTFNIQHSNQGLRAHHRRRVCGQHPARAAEIARRGHQERFVGHAADFPDHRSKERRAGRRTVSGLQHGHRHGGHRVGGQGGRGFEIHPRAEAQGLDHRRSRQRQRRSAGGLILDCGGGERDTAVQEHLPLGNTSKSSGTFNWSVLKR